jgi:hypothetical protein
VEAYDEFREVTEFLAQIENSLPTPLELLQRKHAHTFSLLVYKRLLEFGRLATRAIESHLWSVVPTVFRSILDLHVEIRLRSLNAVGEDKFRKHERAGLAEYFQKTKSFLEQSFKDGTVLPLYEDYIASLSPSQTITTPDMLLKLLFGDDYESLRNDKFKLDPKERFNEAGRSDLYPLFTWLSRDVHPSFERLVVSHVRSPTNRNFNPSDDQELVWQMRIIVQLMWQSAVTIYEPFDLNLANTLKAKLAALTNTASTTRQLH